ncbi:MAG: hypothetical protein KC505_10645 [Myxococcales bacterium]|nr:hypothetical protein [Myxococcales bacterium]USN49780.1 MAG: hypothetical protein H6731_05725 [Myxococcales bacterium]
MLRKTGSGIFHFFSVLIAFISAFFYFSSCCFYSNSNLKQIYKNKAGKLIVFVGVSGSGKSTLAKELSLLINAKLFLEPEENKWPKLITQSHFYGEFAAMMSLRNLRVKNLYDAKKYKEDGFIAITDSYYDKITSYYLGKTGMEWLISPQDPYFHAAELLTKLDTENLPDADCMVLLDIDFETWKKFLNKRKRKRDFISGFQENFPLYRNYIEKSVEKLSEQKNIKLIRVKQNGEDPQTQAKNIKEQLEKQHVLTI